MIGFSASSKDVLNSLAEEEASASSSSIISITANVEMTSYGKQVMTFALEVSDGSEWMSLCEDDFAMSGCITDAVTPKINDLSVTGVSCTADFIILSVEPFLIDLSDGDYGAPLTVTCTEATLSFSYDGITTNSCPEVDLFTDETITIGETTLQYKLFTPESSDEALPLVIYNHGGGNTGYEGVLTDDSYASSWATEESQAKYPCYVMAPYRASIDDETVDSEEEMEALKVAIDDLVVSGQVDADRIYMTGESMGSQYTITFANEYPGYLAAIAIMNGGPTVDDELSIEENAEIDLSSPWSNEELETLANSGTGVMLIQGIGDVLSTPNKYATLYTKLYNYGMTPGSNLMWESYTAAEFNALVTGSTVVPATNSSELATDPITGKETYTNGNFHNTSRVAGYDTTVRNWLMLQTLSDEPVFMAGEDETAMPDNLTKVQTIIYAHPIGSELEITCAMNDDETEFYLSYTFFGELQVAKGTITDELVEVTYDHTGFAAGDAEAILELVDENNWEEIG